MLDPDRDLQEIPSSDDDDDASELRGRIQRIRERGAGIESPEYTSPIGSPPEDGALSAKGRFLELKRMMQDDRSARSSKSKKKSKSKARSASAPEDVEFEKIEDDEWEQEGSISPAASYHDDVEELLESFRSERAGERDVSMASMTHRLENHPKMMEVYQQLRDRDLRILTLESKLLEVDRQVIDLQDTLSERDKLLGSKNEAVNCMVAQYKQTIVEKESELSKTQETLFELQKKFGAAQDQWKVEKDRLNSEVKQQSQRLKDLEDTNKLLESARVEQTTRDLGLEEKLSVLKADRDRLTKENILIQSSLDQISVEKGQLEQNLGRKTEEFETTVGGLKASLEKSSEQMTKMKKQFQVKLKSLKEEIKESSADTESQAKIEGLQSQITELESQLQNKLSEIDNQASTINSHEDKIAQLELQLQDNSELMELQIQNAELQTQIKELETQLTAHSADKDNETEFELQISQLENRVAEFEVIKGSLMLVHEELAQVKSEKETASKDFMERLGEYEKNFEERIDEYEKKVEEYETKTTELTASLEKSTEQLTKMKRQFQVKLKALKEERDAAKSRGGGGSDEALQAKCSQLENRVAELEDEKGNNLWIQEELSQAKLEKESMEKDFDERVKDYETKIEDLKNSLEQANDQLSVSQMDQKSVSYQQSAIPVESQTRITELEHQVAELEEEKGSGYLLEEEISKLKSERESLESGFALKEKEYEQKIDELNLALTKSTEQMTKMKRQFQVKLKQLRDSAKEGTPSGSPTPTPGPEAEAQFLMKITSLENRVAELEEEKGNMMLKMIDYDEQQARKDVTQENSSPEETIRLEINLAEKEEELRTLQSQLDEMASALSQKNIEVEQLMKNCSEMQQSLQLKVDELSSSVNSKEEEVRRVMQDFEEENCTATERISTLEKQLLEQNSEVLKKDGELQDLLTKLTSSESRFDEMNALVTQYQGMFEGVRGHDQQELENLKEELSLIQEKAVLAEQSYEAMKSRYTEEMERKMQTITELQTELNIVAQELALKTTQITELNNNYHNLQQHLDLSKVDENKALKQIDSLNEKIAEKEKEIQELKASAQDNFEDVDLQSGFDEKERHFKMVESQMLIEIAEKNGEIERLSWELTSKENVTGELESNLAACKEEAESYKSKIGELTQYSENLQNEIQAVRNHYANFEANYNQMYQELGQKSAELQQYQGQSVDNDVLKQKEQLEEELRKQGFIIEDLNSNIQHMQNEKASMQYQIDQFNTDGESLKTKLTEMTNEYIQLRESIESKESEAQRLRQDASTLQTEYSQSNNELKLKISTLMDQLNECENEISVVTTRLKESDDVTSEFQGRLTEATKLLEEKSLLLEEKAKSLETVENSLFEKTEEAVKLEEKMKELEEKHKLEVESNFVKYSDDLDTTYEQLAATANEKVVLQEQLKKAENEIQDLSSQIHQFNGQLSQFNQEVNDYRDRVSYLETQLSLSAKHFEEVKSAEGRESLKIAELQRELEEKQVRINELNVQVQEMQHFSEPRVSQGNSVLVAELEKELEEKQMRLNEFAVQFQEMQHFSQANVVSASLQQSQPHQDNSALVVELEAAKRRIQELEVQQQEMQQMQINAQNSQIGNSENSAAVGELQRELEEKQMRINELTIQLQEMQHFSQTNVVTASLQQSAQPQDNSAIVAELEGANRRIYELEVQLAEIQINEDDASAQALEVSELKASLEALSYKIRELEEENSKLKMEIERLRNEQYENERARAMQSYLNVEGGMGQPQQSQNIPVHEEPCVQTTAYVTTDPSLKQGETQQSSSSEASLKEIKELKVKNGKMIQRFKQLKDKFDAVVKENVALKTKKQFSLDSAFEDEFMSQVKAKEKELEEQGKLLAELQIENVRLTEKLDLTERGTERLTELKEEQDRSVQAISLQKRSLENEISALKWKIEELENLSLGGVSTAGGDQGQGQSDSNNYFNINAGDQAQQENSTLRQDNAVLSHEIQSLRVELQVQKKAVDELHERNQQLEEEIEKLQELQIEQHEGFQKKATRQPFLNPAPAQQTFDAAASYQSSGPQAIDSAVFSTVSLDTIDQGQNVQSSATIGANINPNDPNNYVQSLQLQLQSEQQEKIILERKIELLQSKISEIEISEIKCFEESLMLKSWTRQLELDNLKVQRELERIYGSIQEGDTGNLKVKVLQDEVVRLVDALQDRDKRCEQLTMEITRLLEERDTLQLKLSNVLRHNVSLHEEANKGKEPPSTTEAPSYDREAIQIKLCELEQINYSMGIDLRREREARRLVQEQLFFSSSSRTYPGATPTALRQSASPVRASTPLRSSTPNPPSPPLPSAPYSSPVTPPQQSPPNPQQSQGVPAQPQSSPQFFQPQQTDVQFQPTPSLNIAFPHAPVPQPPPSESSNPPPSNPTTVLNM